MTVHTPASPSHTSAGSAPASTGGTPSAHSNPEGRLGRITAASLGFGAVTALAVPAVVLSGSAEHVVTGTALLSLALGWALLAVLSTRLTTQPQRWAVVPAISMAAAGAGQLLRPRRPRKGPTASSSSTSSNSSTPTCLTGVGAVACASGGSGGVFLMNFPDVLWRDEGGCGWRRAEEPVVPLGGISRAPSTPRHLQGELAGW